MIELISVGTELLLGDIVNTNAAYLSKRLASLGIPCIKQTTVGDNAQRLYRAFEDAHAYCDTIIVTGGLGPTDDDLTRDVAADYMGQPLCYHESIWQHIQDFLFKRDASRDHVTNNNKKQAYVPQGATILNNKVGTAPGLLLEKEGKRIILLPGPPFELKPMFEEQVVPLLLNGHRQTIVSRYLRFYGIGESPLEEVIKPILDAQTNPTIALYAKTMEAMIRITARADSQEEALCLIEDKIKEISNLVGSFIYLIGDDHIAEDESFLPQVLAQQLMERNLTISVAESITGGNIASSLIDQSGVSSVFMNGVVAYSNQAKMDILHVKEESLKAYGAVSAQVAEEMARGVAHLQGTDVAIATTGIAGPKSDNTHKPVGLVYIATKFGDKVQVEKYQWSGSREWIRKKTTYTALNQLRLMINQ